MQGPRGAIGSLPETLGFDHGSTSSDTGVDQQICWNNVQSSAQNRVLNYTMSSNDTSITYLNSMSPEGQNLSGRIGEPGSSIIQNQVGRNEQKTEHGWSSSIRAHAGAGSLIDEPQYSPANILSLNNANVNLSTNQIANGHFFLQGSSSNSTPHDLNINSAHGVDDCCVIECPNVYKSGVSDNMRIPTSSSSSEPFELPSGNGPYMLEENDGLLESFEGSRISCKRRALEGNVGQSSGSGSSNYFHPAESNQWHSASARFNTGTSLSISSPPGNILGVSPSEQVNPCLGLGVGVVPESSVAFNPAGSLERSRRNFRLRINDSHQQDSIPSNVFPTSGPARHSNVSSSHQSSSLLRPNTFPSSTPAQAEDNTMPQGHSLVLRLPSMRRHLQSSRRNGGSTSRPGNSSIGVSAARNARLEANSGNMVEHPIFSSAADMRNSTQNPTNWNLTGGNISISGNVASTSWTGSSSGRPSPPAPALVSHRSPPQYPFRLSELVRRSLLSSAGSESGGHSHNHIPLHSGPPASSREMPPSSGTTNQGTHVSHSRAAISMERQLDGTFGIPYSSRTLAAAGEGRSRLASEIRSVLDLMRRGEGLRFEDIMILDQSVFFGIPDIHDRHRDMRLDVDNMSYEELLALEERIGNVCTGLSEETILNHLKQRRYTSITTEGQQLQEEPCCICQEEYADGDDLGTLECGHDFHNNCIKHWLMQKNLCPICKTTALPK